MKRISLILLACSVGAAVQAQVGFQDSLNGDTLNYQWTPLNFAGTGSSGASVSFADTSGNGLESDVSGFSGTAVQGVYFNTTGANLPIGDMLTCSVNWQTANGEDFGICVGDNPTPTAASGDGSDVRNGTAYVFAAIRGSSWHVTSSGYDGTAGQLGLLQYQPGSGTTTTLGIARTAASTFDIYYDQGSGMTLLGTQTITTSTSVGNTVGFYNDIRANGNPAYGYLANLQIVPIPEPTSLALCGLGGLLGLVAVRRRRTA